jgi:hypothetical protein
VIAKSLIVLALGIGMLALARWAWRSESYHRYIWEATSLPRWWKRGPFAPVSFERAVVGLRGAAVVTAIGGIAVLAAGIAMLVGQL